MMKALRSLFASCLLLIGSQAFAQPVIEIGDIRVEYRKDQGKIVLVNRNTGEVFSSVSPNAIQVLNWSLAMADTLKAGLSEKRDILDTRLSSWLVSGQNGKAGVFHLDTRHIVCERAHRGNVMELLYLRPKLPPLKLVEGTEESTRHLREDLEFANNQGGAFLRFFVKDDATIDASVCVWNENHPAEPFDQSAWRQTSTRIGRYQGLSLFKELVVVDPESHPYGFEFKERKLSTKVELVNEKLVLSPWQRDALLALEHEARERGKVIACAMGLRDIDLAKDPWAREAFCFVIDRSVIPVSEHNAAARQVTKRVGLRKVTYTAM